MDFALSVEQEEFRRAVARFVDAEVAPVAHELDEAGEYPRALFRRFERFARLPVPRRVSAEEELEGGLRAIPAPGHTLGHIAVCRRLSVQFSRADKLFSRLRAARLDNTLEVEMRRQSVPATSRVAGSGT